MALAQEPHCFKASREHPKGDDDETGSLQTNNLSVPQPQQQGKKSVHANCSQSEQRRIKKIWLLQKSYYKAGKQEFGRRMQ